MPVLTSTKAISFFTLALLAACAPNPQPPVKMMVMATDPTGTYKTQLVELTTLTQVAAFKSDVVTFAGGARIVIDPQDPLLAAVGGTPTDKQLSEIVQKDKGGDVRGNFIDKSGVLWPADFHTWNMASIYWNIEQSYRYWNGVYGSQDTDELLGARMLYWASFQDLSSGGRDEAKDNALFFPLAQGFLILPFAEPVSAQVVPFSLNLGVMAHEYSHWVFNLRAYGGAYLPAALSNWQNQPALNLLKAIDEGFADFHGYSTTCLGVAGCRPNFLSDSIKESQAVARDISIPGRCMDSGLKTALLTQSPNQFLGSGSQYRVGTLIASSLYQASVKAGGNKLRLMQQALLSSYDDERPGKLGFRQLFDQYATNSSGFTPELVANTIINHVDDPELKRLTCNELLDRLALNCPSLPCDDFLPACPATSAKGTAGCL